MAKIAALVPEPVDHPKPDILIEIPKGPHEGKDLAQLIYQHKLCNGQ